jgi:uroporphyrinogen-III synthase
VDLPVYRTVAASQEGKAVAEALEAGAIDGVSFSSSSTVTHFQGLFSAARWKALAPKVRGLCLGPITRASAEAAGIAIAVEAREASLGALVEAIVAVDGRA